MDREAWRAAVQGVTKNGTRLRDWTELWVKRKAVTDHLGINRGEIRDHLWIKWKAIRIICELRGRQLGILCEFTGGWLGILCEFTGGWLGILCELTGGWLGILCELRGGPLAILCVLRGSNKFCFLPVDHSSHTAPSMARAIWSEKLRVPCSKCSIKKKKKAIPIGNPFTKVSITCSQHIRLAPQICVNKLPDPVPAQNALCPTP